MVVNAGKCESHENYQGDFTLRPHLIVLVDIDSLHKSTHNQHISTPIADV
jgi:hypothetical protein